MRKSMILVLVVLVALGWAGGVSAKKRHNEVKELCKSYISYIKIRFCIDLYRIGEGKSFTPAVIVATLGESSWRSKCNLKVKNALDQLSEVKKKACLAGFTKALQGKKQQLSPAPRQAAPPRQTAPPRRITPPPPRRTSPSNSSEDDDDDDDDDLPPARRTTPPPQRIQVRQAGNTCTVYGYGLRQIVLASVLARLRVFKDCVKKITHDEMARRTAILAHYSSSYGITPKLPIHIFVIVTGYADKFPYQYNAELASQRGTQGRIAYRLLYVGDVRKKNRLVLQAGPPVEGSDVETRGLTIKVDMGLDEVRAVQDMHAQLLNRLKDTNNVGSSTSSVPAPPSFLSPQALDIVKSLNARFRALTRQVDEHDRQIRANKAKQGARLDDHERRIKKGEKRHLMPFVLIEGIVSTRSWFMVARSINTPEVHGPFAMSLGGRLSIKLLSTHDAEGNSAFAWYIYATLLLDPFPIVFERLSGFGFSYSFGFLFEFKHRYAFLVGVGGYEMALREDPGNLSTANGGWSARPQIELGFRWRFLKVLALQANIRYLHLVRFDKIAHGLGFDVGLTVGNF